MRNVLLLSLALMLAVAIVPGCGLMAPEESSESTPTLTDDYGGFTTDDESPGFGDSDLLAAFPEDPEYDDEIRNHRQVVDARNKHGAKHYMLRIVWGNLAYPDSAGEPAEDCPVTDWSGSLEVQGGVAVIQRLIRFDLGDEILRPRSNAHRVEWISHTQPDVDGILFHIIDPPQSDSAASGNNVTVTTPFCTVEIPMADLADHREFIEFDQCNKLSIVATEVASGGCPRGFLEGVWIVETDTSGTFVGAWIGQDGAIGGHLQGGWVKSADGSRRLFGKWIDRSGTFGGLISGTWTPLDLERGPDGYFEGRWVNSAYTVEGFIAGHYCIWESGQGGFFHGRWVKDCR